MKEIVFLSAFALATAILAGGCSHSTSESAGAAPVLVTESLTTNVPVQIEPPPVGHVVPYSTVTVRPQIGGVLQAVHFQEGQEIKKGDLLFSIDPRPAQAALAAAKAALERGKAQLANAKIQFSREQKLFAQKLVSQDAFDTSRAIMDALQATVLADEAALTNAALNLGYTEIRSPIDGVAGALQFYQGNVVKAPDDTLVILNQIHPIYVQFGVPEQFLPEIRKETRSPRGVNPSESRGKNPAATPKGEHSLQVSVSFDGMDELPPRGELTFIDNSVDQNTGMIQLKATFPNENGVLWPGQFVTVDLTLSELTNAIVVPSQAVQTGQNGEFIYVVKPDQTAEERPVTVGITYDGQTVIKRGLNAGETVVTDGQLRLTPGAKVSVKDTETTNSMNNSTASSE